LALRLYNSLGREVSLFEPIKEGEVRMYTCGPTVWNYAHLGNYRTFVFEDILRRYLKFKGFAVTQVMNITDVEDKIIKGMKLFNKSLEELTAHYERAFMDDIASLNIERAEVYPHATKHIPEMVELIRTLMRKGYAYRADDGSIYYDVSKFERYGDLSGIRPSQLVAGARVKSDSYDKDQANDFALWKAWDEDDGDVFWETELGKGRPGWHIECSAMSMKYLGETFDIHTGGIDNKFPHHENEIAQSEAATGKKFVRYWLHSDFLNVKGEEMHKSVGNVVTLRELVEKGWKPRVIRLFLLSAHYRDKLDLTDESLQQARTNIARMDAFAKRLQEAGAVPEGSEGVSQSRAFLDEFERAMDDDLNVAQALAALYGLQRAVNSLIDSGGLSRSGREAVLAALKRADSVLGVMQPEVAAPISARVEELIHAREDARRRRDYRRADEIREQLRREGITIEDKPGGGTSWRTG
jgi:cysteinyl-tRNA synthetase